MRQRRGRTRRLALEVRHGRSRLGQFFQRRRSTVLPVLKYSTYSSNFFMMIVSDISTSFVQSAAVSAKSSNGFIRKRSSIFSDVDGRTASQQVISSHAIVWALSFWSHAAAAWDGRKQIIQESSSSRVMDTLAIVALDRDKNTLLL